MPLSRDELAERYLAQLPYTPYPLQEEAVLTWYTGDNSLLVCAPTGTGKTLVAEAALFEALHTGKTAYYTTPLIALTEQKFAELTAAAVRWGFHPEDVGLVTGNRRVNPDARLLVVVAEILLNRLLHTEAFSFADVATVVMDEFHSFSDPERGIVWELSLGLLPRHVRLMLLSATVGNVQEFLRWLERTHDRKVDLVAGQERRVPLTYQWVGDELLEEQLVRMAQGDAASRLTPALVFCFNRDQCWSVAEQLKGRTLVGDPERSHLLAALNLLDWTRGAGTKLRQMLQRGVGVHHAGLLPKYRRLVEDLYQRKLLAVCVCTETLAAGINLPARSVVVTSLLKGPRGEKKLLDASTAHQIFGRAGRPQFDDRGYVFTMAHEDDVRILRWKEKYDAIPDDTKDPGLLKAKKALKKKRPTRRETEQYWTEAQFQKLIGSPPGGLYSKGPLPWRLLAYMLEISPDVALLRRLVRKRLMDEPRIKAGEQALIRMLKTLAAGGYVTLEPAPPDPADTAPAAGGANGEPPPPYAADVARPTESLPRLLVFRSIHPMYGVYLSRMLEQADSKERIQALESVLGLPTTVLRGVRVPPPDEVPPGPLETQVLDPELISRGLIAAPLEPGDEDQEDEFEPWEERVRPPVLADKLHLLFEARFPEADDVTTQAVWAANELDRFGGDFDAYVKSRDLIKQEGILFRHFLRLILLCGEFLQLPAEAEGEAWRTDIGSLAARLTESCRGVDPTSTDEAIARAQAADVVEGEPGGGK